MLGSRKFLIFVFVSALLLSLLIVGAFAAEPEDVKALGGGGVLKVAPASFQIPNGSLFRSSTYVGTVDSINGSRGYGLVSAYPATAPVSVTYISVQCQDLLYNWSSFVYTESFDSPVDVYFINDNGFLRMYVSGEEILLGYSAGRVRAVFQNLDYELAPVGNELTLYTIEPRFNVGALLSSILGIGNKLIAFVISRPIVLIPTVAMILVLSYGVIRRLIKGV